MSVVKIKKRRELYIDDEPPRDSNLYFPSFFSFRTLRYALLTHHFVSLPRFGFSPSVKITFPLSRYLLGSRPNGIN